jgi:hypothetical protein
MCSATMHPGGQEQLCVSLSDEQEALIGPFGLIAFRDSVSHQTGSPSLSPNTLKHSQKT